MSSRDHQERESDETFFERVFDETFRHTLAYAERRTRDVQDAQDVVADTYLVAWRRLDELRKARELQAWLYGVAYKMLGNQRRGEKRRQRLTEKAAGDPPEQRTDDPLKLVMSGEELEQVEKAMATLSPRDQEVLRLAAWEGLSHREIGVALGVSRPLVRKVLYRARQRLDTALEQAGMRHSTGSGHNPDVTAHRAADTEREADG